jgi:putative glutamine amidotransferase
MPILGICRGAQLLNVARQGTLHQHVPDFTNGTIEHRQREPGTRTSHEVRVAPDSSLAQTTGGGPVKVNSFHHQAIAEIGFGLRAVAWSEDGLIEAVEENEGRFILGVQWHAETLVADAEQLSLFERLVEATKHPGLPAPRERERADRGGQEGFGAHAF